MLRSNYTEDVAYKYGNTAIHILGGFRNQQCNLHCAGCYSRCNHATVDSEPVKQLTADEWTKIFDEADEIGISFILLAGGEPMLRRDIIEAAGRKQNILFPIFTNGTFVDEEYYSLFDKCRNLLPVMSIEGDREATDNRRGKGIYDRLISNMEEFKKRKLIFGASVTVTTQNYKEVTSREFLNDLSERGCKAVIFVEYVPVTVEDKSLAPDDEQRMYLMNQIENLRKEHPEMIYISFPGDEKSSGGCVAAGRGFFHINSHGGAEPCPFSPFSDVNVKTPRFVKLFIHLSSPHYGTAAFYLTTTPADVYCLKRKQKSKH